MESNLSWSLLILAWSVIVVVLVILIFRRNKSPEMINREKSPLESTGSPPVIKPVQGLTSEIQRKALLELYPVLKAIPYFVPDQTRPPALEAGVDETILQRIKERFSEQSPHFMNYGDLLNLLRSPDSKLSEITSLVSTNPLFSAKILQVVNSAFFGFRDKIESVGRAISLLGYNNVKSLVLQDYVSNIIPSDQKENTETYSKIWVHSAIVSACSGYFAQNIFQFSPYEFGTMGLLHDIGKYFIPALDHQGEAAPGLPGIIQEEEIYGLNHALMGSLITEKWELSNNVIHCIKYHHHPFFVAPDHLPENYRKQSFVIALADLAAKVLGYAGDNEDLFPIRDEYYHLYGLKPDLQEVITPALIKELEKARLTVLSYVQTAAPKEKTTASAI